MNLITRHHYFTSIDYKKECKMKHGTPYIASYMYDSLKLSLLDVLVDEILTDS